METESRANFVAEYTKCVNDYNAFVNYRAIVGKIAQKMMMGYGKGNRGAFLAGLKRELDKEYAEAKRVYESTTPSDFIEG